jgi:methionyl aminopeptidase
VTGAVSSFNYLLAPLLTSLYYLFSAKALTWPDEWTATTLDGKRSAQFEHTLLITPDGIEALTGKIEGSPLQFWEKESKVNPGFWLGNTAEARERAAALTAKASDRVVQ